MFWIQFILLCLLGGYFGCTVGMAFFARLKARRTGAAAFCVGRYSVLYVRDQDFAWPGRCAEFAVVDRDRDGEDHGSAEED